MVFSSIIFLLYFLPAFILLYFVLPKKYRNVFIVFSGIVFYAWGAPQFIFLLLISTFADYFIGKKISNTGSKRHRKALFYLSLFLNVGMLFYFKYCNFFIDNFNFFVEKFGFTEIKWIKVALPIGISFFTFQKLGYIIDLHRFKKEPFEKFSDFFVFVFLFPNMIAGPIVRFQVIKDQLNNRFNNSSIDNFLVGFHRFVIGLAKKMLIANTLGHELDALFSTGIDTFSSLTSWIFIVGYSFQIYFDFSGYSDMAIGLARILGFKIPENFSFPYISKNIREFWRKWHISLTSWFRDYIFLPIAFSVSKKWPETKYVGWKTDNWIYLVSAIITFFLTGLWHGASWNFVIWGVYHGVFMVLDQTILKKILKKTGVVFNIVFTFFIVVNGWVLFRLESMQEVLLLLKKMYSFKGDSFHFSSEFWTALMVAVIVTIIPAFGKIQEKILSMANNPGNLFSIIIKTIIIIFLFLICLSKVLTTGFNPFIYFRF